MPATDLFETTFGYLHDDKLFERATRKGAVRDGLEKVEGHWRTYRVGVETNAGYTEGTEKGISEARDRALHLSKKFPNRKVRVRAFKDGVLMDQVRFVTLRKNPDPAGDLRLCEGCRKFIGWVEAEKAAGRLTGVRYAGGCVCKSTQFGSHSDHADCAAIDIFADAKSMERMRDVLRDNPEVFDLKYVILYRTIYFPDGSSHAYSGDYHAHVHASFYGGKFNSAC